MKSRNAEKLRLKTKKSRKTYTLGRVQLGLRRQLLGWVLSEGEAGWRPAGDGEENAGSSPAFQPWDWPTHPLRAGPRQLSNSQSPQGRAGQGAGCRGQTPGPGSLKGVIPVARVGMQAAQGPAPAGRPCGQAPQEAVREPLGPAPSRPSRAPELHKAPTDGPGTLRIIRRTPREAGAAAHQQHAVRENENSSHLIGAEELGEAGAASVSPGCKHQQRKRRRLTQKAPFKHRDPEVGTGGQRGEGVSGLRAPPPLPLPIGLRSCPSRARKEGLRAYAPDSDSSPGNGGRLPRPAPTWS